MESDVKRYIDSQLYQLKKTCGEGGKSVTVVQRVSSTTRWEDIVDRPDMSLYLTVETAAETYLSRGTGDDDGMTRFEISECYWDKNHAWSAEQHESFAGGITSLSAEFVQYQKIEGMTAYQEISGMTAYLGTGEAAMTYQTIEGMTAYLGTADAANTYQPISGMTEYLDIDTATNTFQEKLPIDPYSSEEKYLAEDGAFREISGESFVTKEAVDNAIGATSGVQGQIICLYNDTGEWSTVSCKQVSDVSGIEIDWNTQSDTVFFEPMYFSSNTRMISSVLDGSRYLYVPNITLEYESSGDYGLTVDNNYATIINAGTVNSRLETSESDIYALDGRLTVVEADLGTASAILQMILDGGE